MDGGPGSIILELERKLNKERYNKRGRRDLYSKISVNKYWDLLKYIDDDYLTEWEILKFKDLYMDQLCKMLCQSVTMVGLGYLSSVIITAPYYRGPTNAFLFRMPVFALMTFFFSIQSGHWMRPNETFHDIM